MSLGVCALLGAICTAVSLFGWPFAFSFLPEISFVSPMVIIIVATVLYLIVFSLCMYKKEKGVAKFFFILLIPLYFGIMFHFGNKASFTAQAWWMTLLAAGAALLLLVVCMVILNAMDMRHSFAFWLAVLFFVAVAIGLYFLMKMWISESFAEVFGGCAILGILFTGWMMDLFPEY